jgi:hypothetical protein
MKTGLTNDILKSNFKEFDVQKGGQRTGFYTNTSENRKKSRVGQKYSVDKEERKTYFDSYGAAIDYAHDHTSKLYKVDDDDWMNILATGGKPHTGHTKRGLITLYNKDTGKELKNALAVQVYNRGTEHGRFELNFYVN